MTRYNVLRNNTESGPFFQEELRRFGLLSTDLIWIEGESRSWQYAGELPDLTGLIRNGIRKPLPSSQPKQSIENTNVAVTYPAAELAGIVEEEGQSKSFHFSQSPSKRGDFVLFSKLFAAASFLMVGGFVYFLTQQLIQRAEMQSAAASTAVEIKAETLGVSTSQHAAFAGPALPQATPVVLIVDSGAAQPLLAKKILRKSKTMAATGIRDTSEAAAPPTVSSTDPETVAVAEEKTKPAEPIDAASSIQLSANDYKVGMFGGVSGLQLTLTNSAAVHIESAIVEVDFLKPNGSVAKTQLLTVQNIGAGGTKTVDVPESNRGVKVRFRVVSATAGAHD